MSAQGFANRWLGKRTDQDGVYGYQCVDLIKAYTKEEFGIVQGAWGNAIDYWTNTKHPLLSRFDREASQSPKAGDIIVFHGLPGNPYGHIAVAINGTTMLEQNGATGDGDGLGGDEIRYRTIPKSRIAGLLRPKTNSPPTGGNAGGSKVTTAEAKSMITGLTKRVFGKTIDAGGMKNYVDHVTSGRYTPEKAVTEIFDSPQAQAYLKSKYQTTKTVTKTVEKVVRDPEDVKKIDELSKALEIAKKNAGTGSNEDISYIRQKVDWIVEKLTSIFK